jgi:hypothetical protein
MSVPAPVDIDQDGLADAIEQALLVKSYLRFMLNVSDCGTLPAEFRPELSETHRQSKSRTIFDRVFLTVQAGKSGAFCGALDQE